MKYQRWKKLFIATFYLRTENLLYISVFKYNVFCIDGRISVRINLPLFSTVVPSNILDGTMVENKGKLILTRSLLSGLDVSWCMRNLSWRCCTQMSAKRRAEEISAIDYTYHSRTTEMYTKPVVKVLINGKFTVGKPLQYEANWLR